MPPPVLLDVFHLDFRRVAQQYFGQIDRRSRRMDATLLPQPDESRCQAKMINVCMRDQQGNDLFGRYLTSFPIAFQTLTLRK